MFQRIRSKAKNHTSFIHHIFKLFICPIETRVIYQRKPYIFATNCKSSKKMYANQLSQDLTSHINDSSVKIQFGLSKATFISIFFMQFWYLWKKYANKNHIFTFSSPVLHRYFDVSTWKIRTFPFSYLSISIHSLILNTDTHILNDILNDIFH